MRSVKFLVAAGAASLFSTLAFAADMPSIMPPPQMSYAPPPIEDFGGWYLRGDIGFSNQRVSRLNNALDSTLTTSDQRLGFDSAGIFALGAGYQFNHWFRADITGEYRASASFSGVDLITFPGGFGSDVYHAHKSDWLVLANAYVDLGTWWCITPFIGAGVGTARVAVSDFIDQGVSNIGGAGAVASMAYGDNMAKWNFAWALHAGLAYKVNQNFTIELAYRYLNMGDGLAGDLKTFDGTNNINNPMTFKSLTSQDLMLGVRWNLETPQTYAPPLIRKG